MSPILTSKKKFGFQFSFVGNFPLICSLTGRLKRTEKGHSSLTSHVEDLSFDREVLKKLGRGDLTLSHLFSATLSTYYCTGREKSRKAIAGYFRQYDFPKQRMLIWNSCSNF